MRRLLLYVVTFLLAFDAPAIAADLSVEQPWARATPGRAPTGAAYLTLVNRGKDDDRLLGVYSSVEAARAAYESWPDRGYYPFIRIERRDLDGTASERHPDQTVYETGLGED